MSICDCPGTAAKAQIESSYFGSSLSLCWICWLHGFQFLAWLLALQCHGTCTNFRLNSFFLHFLCWTCPGNQQGSTRLKASEAIIMLASAMDAANAATKPSSHSLETLGHKRHKMLQDPTWQITDSCWQNQPWCVRPCQPLNALKWAAVLCKKSCCAHQSSWACTMRTSVMKN